MFWCLRWGALRMWKSLRESACEGHFGAAETSQENITPVFPKTSHPLPPKHHNQNRPRTRHELEQHKQHKENNTHCTSITRKTTHNSTNNTGSNNTGKTTSKDFCIAPRHKASSSVFLRDRTPQSVWGGVPQGSDRVWAIPTPGSVPLIQIREVAL